ncbi:MAG: glycine--tRNA ligase [Desulfurococcaceae archaeon]|nr:glycine--tRNA ligase [Desulfurococcaceae archaeon]
MSSDKYEKIVDLAARRGFFWPSYEIYGGLAGFYDLGPLGSLLKENIRKLWLDYFVFRHQDMVVLIETPVIAPEIVFKASGHVESFTDPIVTCSKCGKIYRADHLLEDILGIKVEGLRPEELTSIIREKGVKCPSCGGELEDVRTFNLLFQTNVGPYKHDVAYLRPEAAQGMFTSFKRVFNAMRYSLPLGIAQVGRVARNEISPRQGMVRLREFTIMEVEFFFDPEDAEEPDFSRFPEKLRILTADARSKGLDEVVVVRPEEAVAEGIVLNKWLAYWMSVAQAFAKELGLREDEILFEEKLPEERAHYSKQTFDQLVSISRWGWVEISGHAYRTDYDLSRHMQFSGEDMTVYRELKKPKEVTKKSVVIDQELLKEYFGSDTPRVLQALRRLSVEEVEKILSEGEVIVDGFKVPARVFRIEEVKEVVRGRRFIPHVVEPSFGAERLLLVVLDKAYYEEGGRVVLKLPPKLAPYKLAVFPLIPKEESLRTLARRIYHDAVKAGLTVIYDEDGSIGRRYARVDEIGVPFAVTVDYQSLEDNTVTVRFRDSREQIRIKSDEVIKWVLNNL